MFKFGDTVIYIIFIIIFSILIIFIFSDKNIKYSSRHVNVYYGNKLTYTFPLSKNKHIYILNSPLGKEKLEVNNFKTWKLTASCPQKICIREGKISHVGQFIICLPNQEVIKIIGKKITKFDGIV